MWAERNFALQLKKKEGPYMFYFSKNKTETNSKDTTVWFPTLYTEFVKPIISKVKCPV
jgi:hypothetical protein